MEHGTENCYVNRPCRRPECREAHRKARARRELLKSRGWQGKVPAAEVRPHVDRLLALGWSADQIERKIGARVVDGVLAGRPLYAKSAAKILAVDGPPVDGRVPSGLTLLRIHSLNRAGWSAAEIRRAAGLQGDDAFKTTKWTYATTARAVLVAYRQLENRWGPSKRAAAVAARAGWPLPAEWDDPGTLAWGDAEPWTPPSAARVPHRPVEWDDLRWADVEHLRSFGVPDAQIAERFGIKPATLEKAERRAGRRTSETPAA